MSQVTTFTFKFVKNLETQLFRGTQIMQYNFVNF